MFSCVTQSAVSKDFVNIIKTETEKITVQGSEIETTKIGVHLERSCDNIISKGFASSDGLYKIGINNDSFDVYCDMDSGSGWTLIAKSSNGDGNPPNTTSNWFLNGLNESDIQNNDLVYNAQKSAIGLNVINKIAHKNKLKVIFVSGDQTQERSFYKDIIASNIQHWFKTTEPTPTKTCINEEMTSSCDTRSFENYSNRYWLRGMTLKKHGFTMINEVDKDIHFALLDSGNEM